MGDRATGAQTIERLVENLEAIADRLGSMNCPVILNTIYDPTDGDDEKAAELELGPEARQGLREANGTVVRLAQERGFLLCDLHTLFRGHGYWSPDPWIVMHIEPNLKGATAIAENWYALVKAQQRAGDQREGLHSQPPPHFPRDQACQ